MKRPTKKSSVKKSKSKKKSPLLKYQTAGPALGSSQYSGFDQGLNYQGLDFNFTPTSDPTLASPQRYEGASVMPGSSSQAMPTASSPSAGDIAGGVAGAVSGIGSSVMAGLQDTSVKDPSGYFNQSTINRIERARKGQKEAGIASGIGTTISSIAPFTGPAAPFLLAIGALTTAGSEIARASYKGTEGKSIGDYDERVRQRNLQKQRRNRILQQQKMYSQPNYYDLGETGGLKKYMGGGFTKVTGPSHENGGVPMDLSGDGVIDSELEGGEIIETMKGGGRSGQKYIWSDHLKKGGKSFAKNFEEMKRKGKPQAAIEGLRVDQEIAANRDPNMLYAKYGGMMKYQTGETVNGGTEKRAKRTPFQQYLAEPSLQGSGRHASDTLIYNDPRRFDFDSPETWGQPMYRSGDDAALAKAFTETYTDLRSLLPGGKQYWEDVHYLKYLNNARKTPHLNSQRTGKGVDHYARVEPTPVYQNGGNEDPLLRVPNYAAQYDTIPYSGGRGTQLYNDPFADKKKYPVPQGMQFTQRDSLLGKRDRGIELTPSEKKLLGPEADPNFKMFGRVPSVVDPSKMKNGGIHIDPAKRGTFKAQASKMGMGVQEAASKILSAPKGKYSPEMRKKANFAKNFAKRDGGLMKYQTAGLSIDDSKVWQNDTLSPDFIKIPLSVDDSKVWQDDELSPDFIDKEKQAKVYKENSIPEKKNGGLPKYQTGRTYTVQPGETLSGIAQAHGIADYNEIYNLNKALIGSDPGMIKPGQVLTMPGASTSSGMSPALKAAWTNPPLKSPKYSTSGLSPLSGYPGFGAGTLTGSGKRPAATTPPPKESKSIRKELPYGIAAAGALGQLATVASIDAKKGVDPVNVPYIKPPEKESFTRVRDTSKAGREAERRATIREINKATGPQKFALADQARATLLREEEKAKANIDAMNTKIEQAEIALNTSRKDSIDFKNSEIALRNAMSTRDEALRVLESVNNKKKAYGDIFRGATKDILQYYSAEELARATEGERGVMGRFYDNPYDKFVKQYKKQNPGASPQETYAAFQTSLTA